jgi:Carboxypeptidase regulatory-like domain/TonB-dependent Receptor Plug Domain
MNTQHKRKIMTTHGSVAVSVCRSGVLVLCVLVLAILALAQTDSATLSGTIMDRTGAALPSVEVKVTNSETNATITTSSNKVGVYMVPALKPGRYRIVVTKEGFKQVTVTDVVLNVQDIVSRNFTLEVGATSESITVTAESEHLNTSDATVSTVVDRQFVENIPLNGRSFQSLILLTPGVVATKAGFAEQGQFSINGQRANANYYTVDGVSANFSINAGGGTGQAGAGELPALNASGGFSNLVSVDALQEFRIQTSTYAPEFGRTEAALSASMMACRSASWNVDAEPVRGARIALFSSAIGTFSSLPWVRMTARSMKFSNSRMFPGQAALIRASIACFGIVLICFCIRRARRETK